ncbi:hypothetical protein G6F43_012175 [Rhizopus delemar]|nr:hypothetical protein G6F43_012175 [Rhizopus delemar]
MARTNEELPTQDSAATTSSTPPAIPTIPYSATAPRSVVSYASARNPSDGGDNHSAPASFHNFARHTDDVDERQSVPTSGEYRSALQVVKTQYEELLEYVVSGRAQRMNEIQRQLERTNLVALSVEMYPPANRPTILGLIEEQQREIAEKQQQLQLLDDNVEGERTRLQNELLLALDAVPAHELNQLVIELGWPNEDVCRDLNLPYDYILMAKGTCNPTRIATNANNEKVVVQEENDKVTQLLQRISLLEGSLNRQIHGNTSPVIQ